MTHCRTNTWGYIRLCIGFSFLILSSFVPFYYDDIFFNPEIPWWELPEFSPIVIIEIPLFCGFVFFVWWGFRIICWPWGLARTGKWEHMGQSPVYVVHGAVLKSGKVLLFAGKSESNNYPLDSAVWDPETNTFDVQQAGQAGTYQDDLFCCHHSFLADGKLLVNGGDNRPNGHTLKATNVFDPATNQWLNSPNKPPDMVHARWYPTTLTLPEDEGVLTFSGHKDGLDIDGSGVPEVEIFSSSGNNWKKVPNGNKPLKIYPSLHLLPDGRIFYSGTRWVRLRDRWIPSDDEQTALFDRNAPANKKWTNVGHHVIKDRSEGTSVILPPDNKRILVIGGRGDNPDNSILTTDSVELINFKDDNPQWREVQKMNFRRRNVNAVLLPTGKVFVCAGIEGYKWNSDPKPVLTAELYDPDMDRWTKMADMKTPRLYHSVSLLLPDGRVLNAGSIKADGSDEIVRDLEVFSPPYLYCGNSLAKRPKITNIPKLMHHKQTYTLETPDAKCIDKVVLARPGAVTHHTDTEQRIVPVKILSSSQNELRITMPSGTSPDYDAIRGHYMIFIINKKGVPSKSEFVELH